METEPTEIRKVCLEYCKKLLTNRLPKDKFKEDVQLKVDVHARRMKEVLEDDVDFSNELFEKSLKAPRKKNSHKYDFILKTGKSAKVGEYNLFENVWN